MKQFCLPCYHSCNSCPRYYTRPPALGYISPVLPIHHNINMEALWRKVSAYLLVLCTVASAVRMPYRRDFQQREHISTDRTALSRSAVVPAPNIPHSLGSPPRPAHQPWYQQYVAEQSRHNSRMRRPRVHKPFNNIAAQDTEERSDIAQRGDRPVTKQHQKERTHHENQLSSARDIRVVDDTNIPNIDALLHRHARRMNKIRRRTGRLNKRIGRKGDRHSRRKLSSFKKGCRMRRACSIRTVHYRPVCGSDGVMYDNMCMLKVAACMKGSRHAITVTRTSACQNQGAL